MPLVPRRRALGIGLGSVLGAALLSASGRPAPARAAGRANPDAVASARLAADYWQTQPQPYANNADWVNATFHSGEMALYRLTGDPRYREFTLGWAEQNGFALIPSSSAPFHADHETAGQAYLDLYQTSPDGPHPAYLAAVRQRLDAQLSSGSADYWTWVDALHMAMPVFVRMAAQDSRPDYLDYAHSSYLYTRDQCGGPGLWDPARSLWWRDAGFLHTDTYWSRGNGWALADLAKVLGALPPGDPNRAGYAADMRAMAAALKPLQSEDGYWPADLIRPDRYPGPETSGTAFFTYGLAWGVNHGVLPAAVYRPVVERAWQWLAHTALQPSGLLGWVQGTGAKPADNYPWTASSTAAFGVGAFLLAATEVAVLDS
jgi:rhamnogalacturonyl hydrolase YesR